MRRCITPSRPDRDRESLLRLRAHDMRHAPTSSEARLFEALRGKRLGVDFRRQVPIANRYIVDLLAPALRLVVEVDGGYHAQPPRADDRALARMGYCVVRIDTALVIYDLPTAVDRIRTAIDELRQVPGFHVPKRE